VDFFQDAADGMAHAGNYEATATTCVAVDSFVFFATRSRNMSIMKSEQSACGVDNDPYGTVAGSRLAGDADDEAMVAESIVTWAWALSLSYTWNATVGEERVRQQSTRRHRRRCRFFA
jgi:hypothetical protein